MINRAIKPNIIVSPDNESWSTLAAEVVAKEIRETIVRRGACNVMLTGGGTVEGVYLRWAQAAMLPKNGINFLFGDERCVPPDHADSNFNFVMKTLFSDGVPPGCSIERMEGENPNRDEAALAYEGHLPEIIDVLLLGMGADGHVASLFPQSSAFHMMQRSVVSIVGPKPPYERLTITPKVITGSKSTFLLVRGDEKGRVLSGVLKSPEDIYSLPVGLTLSGTWLLDCDAGDQIK